MAIDDNLNPDAPSVPDEPTHKPYESPYARKKKKKKPQIPSAPPSAAPSGPLPTGPAAVAAMNQAAMKVVAQAPPQVVQQALTETLMGTVGPVPVRDYAPGANVPSVSMDPSGNMPMPGRDYRPGPPADAWTMSSMAGPGWTIGGVAGPGGAGRPAPSPTAGRPAPNQQVINQLAAELGRARMEQRPYAAAVSAEAPRESWGYQSRPGALGEAEAVAQAEARMKAMPGKDMGPLPEAAAPASVSRGPGTPGGDPGPGALATWEKAMGDKPGKLKQFGKDLWGQLFGVKNEAGKVEGGSKLFRGAKGLLKSGGGALAGILAYTLISGMLSRWFGGGEGAEEIDLLKNELGSEQQQMAMQANKGMVAAEMASRVPSVDTLIMQALAGPASAQSNAAYQSAVQAGAGPQLASMRWE